MPRTKNEKPVSVDLPPSEWQEWGSWCRQRSMTRKGALRHAMELYKHLPAGLRELVSKFEYITIGDTPTDATVLVRDMKLW